VRRHPAAEADVPAGDDTAPIPLPGEEHLRVRRLLTRMAAAEPHRYVVVEADGTADEVARRVLATLTPMLPAPPAPRGGPDRSTGFSTPPASTTMSSTIRASGEPATSDGASSGIPAVGRAPGDRRPATAGPATAGPANDGAAAGSGAVSTVVDDGKIAASGAKPAPLRFWHRWRRS
jgi:dTMP kinase